MNNNIKGHNKGVALITAMMIVAITGIISSNLLWDNILDTRRTMTTLSRDQGVQIALGVESWILTLLKDDAVNTKSDHLRNFGQKNYLHCRLMAVKFLEKLLISKLNLT